MSSMVALITPAMFYLSVGFLRVAAVSAVAFALLFGFVLTKERQGRIRFGAANLKVTCAARRAG